jgi:hypothetical protein
MAHDFVKIVNCWAKVGAGLGPRASGLESRLSVTKAAAATTVLLCMQHWPLLPLLGAHCVSVTSSQPTDGQLWL